MQKFGICLLSQIPIRQSISHSSEMVSQVLFGEVFCIVESYLHWYKIQMCEDGYEGWLDAKQVYLIQNDVYNAIKDENPKTYVGQHGASIRNEKGESIRIGFGSRLPLFKEGGIKIDTQSFVFNNEYIQLDANAKIDTIQAITEHFLYTPYLWGGRSAYGIDCSGFAQMVYKLCGVQLPRDAREQAKEGIFVNFFEEALPYDLFFFDNKEGEIVHVGIYLGNNKIIHASGCVRMDSVDHQGILSNETNGYTHNLRLISRILKEAK